MNVLVINCGSSSLKFQLINAETEKVLAKGLCERIGIDGRLTYQPAGGEKEKSDLAMPTHTEAIQFVIDALTNEKTGVVKSLDEIGAVGHRLVHGGEKFASSVVITDEVKKAVEECNDLAPLHNPANLIGVAACEKLMPGTPMVAVFDTAFHQTMPEKAYMYGLPYEYYEKYKVRRYGFHGTSHSFVSKRAAEVMGKSYDEVKTIVCHLGNGSSVSAVLNGKCVDTSMGLTPLEGLVMGTRSGDIDPAIMEFIAKKENLDIEGVIHLHRPSAYTDRSRLLRMHKPYHSNSYLRSPCFRWHRGSLFSGKLLLLPEPHPLILHVQWFPYSPEQLLQTYWTGSDSRRCRHHRWDGSPTRSDLRRILPERPCLLWTGYL